MGFGMLAYSLATGGAVTATGMTASVDSDISQRNSHYTFTVPFNLLAHAAFGADITRVSASIPTWNAYALQEVYPFCLSVTIPSPPLVHWFDKAPVPIPMMEEYSVLDTASGSETDTYFMWFATPDWTRNVPRGPTGLIYSAQFTATITGVAAAWAPLGLITFTQALRGGVWAVIGCECQGTNLLAFRLVFPRYKLYNGIRLRPGFLATNALGDKLEPRVQIDPYWGGEWGRFHTFEQPSLEIYKTAATSTTITGYMHLVYLGADDSLLGQGLGGGAMSSQTGLGVAA
jgi:hypothetical protein